MALKEGRKRVVIEGVAPEIDGGGFPIKRTVGEKVVVEADVFADGPDLLSSTLLYRKEGDPEWAETPMAPLVNDRWQGAFEVKEIGRYLYTLQAWVDRFETWRRDLIKKVDAGQDVQVELLIGLGLVKEVISKTSGPTAKELQKWVRRLTVSQKQEGQIDLVLSERLASLMAFRPDQEFVTTYDKELVVVVDREKARFSTWYEMFPRSCAAEPGRHGTFKDCEDRLPYIAKMGFDVLYFPPVHPIGHAYRKGKNNVPSGDPRDPGSPWAIGSEEGGHKAVHPDLGNIEDFRRLLARAKRHGLEIAIDLAFQCSPDHPYVKEHPEWFRMRPDGTIQYAENPPKRYEDIYPFDFETEKREDLFLELKGVVLFWIEQGVRIFRMDNPHTKPFGFLEWLISEIKRAYPDVLFLAEAFTRPKVMYRLAKGGFTQSYTYFAWRNTAWEIRQYFTELTQTPVREFFRPNLWPNTPDILTEYLQVGGRSAFMARLVLAATLCANYGIYGPAFELCENRAREAGSEEYLDSEKYEIRDWDIESPANLRDFIARVNRIRQENPALQGDWTLRFHPVDNEQILCYSKHTEDFSNVILVVVNLDPHHTHGGWLEFPVEEMALGPRQSFQVHDLLSDARFLWHSARNYIEVNPRVSPAFIFRLRRRVRTEQDFDYFM
ncbi:MAG: alpha-1,4-glucan--maltose-1-phosphate maltosyltransferase [Pseudomonadota bacterium]